MSHDTPILNVSDTAFWVAYYRAKETERPDALFHDDLAKTLIGGRGETIAAALAVVSPYTEWSVITRTIAIDRLIADAIRGGVDTILNLGAGLDTRPYRLDLPPSLPWIEVDQPSIIAHKNHVLRSERPRCLLTRVEVDLAKDSERKAFLDDVAPGSKKILALTEGVVPYLSLEQVARLGRDLLARSAVQYWITEYFHSKVYHHLKRAARGAMMKNAPFQFFPDDWFGFFRALGWGAPETKYLGEVAAEFGRTPPMPKWAKLILPLLPKKAREQALRMVGYTLFSRVDSGAS